MHNLEGGKEREKIEKRKSEREGKEEKRAGGREKHSQLIGVDKTRPSHNALGKEGDTCMTNSIDRSVGATRSKKNTISHHWKPK